MLRKAISGLLTGIFAVFGVLGNLASAEEPAGSLTVDVRAGVEAGDLAGLHGLLVQLHGEVLTEVYFAGEDEDWGRPLGVRKMDRQAIHDLRSVTKSIVGLLYGIALEEGKVPGPEQKLVEIFPDYSSHFEEGGKDQITVGHVLSMTMGISWNEDLPYTDPENSEIAMELSGDRLGFILSQPLVHQPGESWNYNGGATALIGMLIERGTGSPLAEYAEERLFSPLGITRFEWARGADGTYSAASGLRLTLPDLARIGQLVVQGGLWDGEVIVPAGWLDRCFSEQTKTREGLGYGCFWWRSPPEQPDLWVAGFGNGGQRLTIVRDSGLVIGIFAGNYNQPQHWKLPVKVITEYVVPHLQSVAE